MIFYKNKDRVLMILH